MENPQKPSLEILGNPIGATMYNYLPLDKEQIEYNIKPPTIAIKQHKKLGVMNDMYDRVCTRTTIRLAFSRA